VTAGLVVMACGPGCRACELACGALALALCGGVGIDFRDRMDVCCGCLRTVPVLVTGCSSRLAAVRVCCRAGIDLVIAWVCVPVCEPSLSWLQGVVVDGLRVPAAELGLNA
jgi:hypothetical protein